MLRNQRWRASARESDKNSLNRINSTRRSTEQTNTFKVTRMFLCVVIELVRSGGSWVEAGRSYSDAGYYAEDEFGDSIDLNSSGSKAAVGANWADDASSNGGVAYVISYPMPM